MALASFFDRMGRTKVIRRDTLTDSQLSRCLGLVDLTAIGVGSTLGVGIYVLAGTVAKNITGPAVILSFMIAAIISVLAGLCYAEFGARMPITGSAYTYAYVAVGEFIAFVIGWSMLAECIVGAASVGKAWSVYVDTLTNESISNAIIDVFGTFDSDFLGKYPDFLALAMVCAMTLIVVLGAKLTSWTMVTLTVINLVVVVICVAVGLFLVDFDNWSQGKGFFPFGFNGVIHGAATCFFAFVGFDVIATSSEESKNPGRDIPLSIMLTLIICFIVYTSISCIITLIVPYYDISENASLAEAFGSRHITVVKYIISVGSIVALTGSMLGAVFPIPRIVFAMARDRVIFPFLGWVHSKTKVPVIACLISGVITAVLATIFSLEQLVDMMSIGTLLSYLLVAMSVIVLRYKPGQTGLNIEGSIVEGGHQPQDLSTNSCHRVRLPSDSEDNIEAEANDECQPLIENTNQIQCRAYLRVRRCTFIFSALTFPLCAMLTFGIRFIHPFKWYSIILVLCFFANMSLMVGLTYVVGKQPQNPVKLTFKTPFLPYLPLLSILCDVYLIMQLSFATWIRFVVWLFFGLCIYFGYGIWHSKVDVAHEPDTDQSGNRVEDRPKEL